VIAYDYPLLGTFWTMFWLFFWVIWIVITLAVLLDLYRSHDLSGLAKAGWLLLIVIFPIVGVTIYMIARGAQMGDREGRGGQDQHRGRPGEKETGTAQLAEFRGKGAADESQVQ
jgi:hypothetical protein